MAVQSTLRYTENTISGIVTKYFTLARRRVPRTTKSARLVATLLLIISLVAGGYGGNRLVKNRAQEKSQERRLLRRNSGLRGKDGSRTIFVPYRSSTAKVIIHPTKPTTFDAHRRLFLDAPRAAVPPPQTKPGLNLAFLHQFLSLLSIMIPHWNSKESGLLLSQGIFLMLRTYLSLVVARLDGEIVRDLVAGHGTAFIVGIVKWCAIGGRTPFTSLWLLSVLMEN